MSIGPRPEPAAPGVVTTAPWSGLLPYLALFVRLAIGLALLDIGLAAVLAGGQGPGRPSWVGAEPGWLPGPGALVAMLPYLALATGVGLVFGIFTTASALLACALTLLPALAVAFELVVLGGLGNSGRYGPFTGFALGRGIGPEVLALIGFGVLAIPGLAALVLLSPVSINRFSIDALIFRGETTFPTPPTGPPRSAESAATTGGDRDHPDQLASV